MARPEAWLLPQWPPSRGLRTSLIWLPRLGPSPPAEPALGGLVGSAHGPAPHRGAGGLSELQAGVARWGHLPATQSSPERVEERGKTPGRGCCCLAGDECVPVVGSAQAARDHCAADDRTAPHTLMVPETRLRSPRGPHEEADRRPGSSAHAWHTPGPAVHTCVPGRHARLSAGAEKKSASAAPPQRVTTRCFLIRNSVFFSLRAGAV